MKNFLPVFTLVFVCFFACTQQAEEKSALCENEWTLLAGPDFLPELQLDFSDSFATNLELIKETLPENEDQYWVFNQAFNFQISSQNKRILLPVYLEKPNCIFCGPRLYFSILINKQQQLLAHGEPCEINELTERVDSFYQEDRLDDEDFRYSFFQIRWEESTDKSFLFSVIENLSKAYLKEANRFSMKHFEKVICDLNNLELRKLKKMRPFRLILPFGMQRKPPPPPPPVE